MPDREVEREMAEDLAAEARAEAGKDEVEKPDQYGRDADYHYPRGYGGLN